MLTEASVSAHPFKAHQHISNGQWTIDKSTHNSEHQLVSTNKKPISTFQIDNGQWIMDDSQTQFGTPKNQPQINPNQHISTPISAPISTPLDEQLDEQLNASHQHILLKHIFFNTSQNPKQKKNKSPPKSLHPQTKNNYIPIHNS